MSSLSTSAKSNYSSLNVWPFVYEHLSDPRTKDWLLVSSFKPILAWVAVYLIMSFYMPRYIRSYKPFKLKKVLIIYNLAMASLNFYICKELITNAWLLNYNYWCEPCRIIYSKDEMNLAAAIWWFFFSKLLEFSDTLFFVLRHKWNQLTPLHIFHHSSMFPLWWIAIKWVPTGSSFFPALINSLIHIIMYTYYGLSACGPDIRKYLWWKKYLTALQLLQFSTGLLWSLQAIATQCDFPLWINCATIIYMTTFLILFGSFYKRQYSSVLHKKKIKNQ